MAIYNCPLCQQQVSLSVYERITGIWKERQKQLAALKLKEQQLEKKAKQVAAELKREKLKIQQDYQVQLKKELQVQHHNFTRRFEAQAQSIEKQKKAIENRFNRQLQLESRKIAKEGLARHQAHLKSMEIELGRRAQNMLEKERGKIQEDKAKLEKKERLQRDQNLKLLKQYQALQTKSQSQLSGAEKKIRSLEEQIEQNKTAQVLGFQNEKEFLAELEHHFPEDKFEHTGKGGDILHYVYAKGNQVGLLVYELKKVAHFSTAHIEQARRAKHSRSADYGLLITNAKRNKNDPGFSTTKGIIIIHPVGAMVLIGILRDNLIQISKLRLSKEERSKTIKAVMEYVQGPSFSNSLESIILDTVDLYADLKKEVVSHTRHWELRLDRYRQINVNANKINSNVVKLLVADDRRKRLPTAIDIAPITLPEKIK